MSSPRIDYQLASPDVLQALLALELSVLRTGLNPRLLQLVKLLASQLNGCAYCLDMERAEAHAAGITATELGMLGCWRESSRYTPDERAVLAWTEALTLLPAGGTAAARAGMDRHYDAWVTADWTLAIAAINCWNRMGIGFRKTILPDT